MARLLPLSVLLLLALSAPALAQGYVCAEGGGNSGKGAWAEEVFGWMVEKGQRGDAVIIGAVPLDAADLPDNREALFTKLGAKSCASLVIDQKNADSQEVYDQLAAASIIFIRGGAQERYVNWWKGTKTEAAIHAAFDKGGVIAGTSAGCAILGEVSYDSKNGSLKPLEALQDARHPHLTLTTDFLGLVPGVLFDTHFTERGRIARLPVMLAEWREEQHRDDIVGMGVDPRTAVCVEPDQTATIRGEGSVSLIQFTFSTRSLQFDGKPPLVVGALYSCLPAGTVIDLKTFTPKTDLVPLFRNRSDPVAVCQSITITGEATKADQPPESPDKKPWPFHDLMWWPRVDLGEPLISVSRDTWSRPADPIGQSVRRLALWPGPMGLLLGPGNKATVEGTTLKIEANDNGPPAAAVVIDTRDVSEALASWSTRTIQNRVVRALRMKEFMDEFEREHPQDAKDLSEAEMTERARAIAAKFADQTKFSPNVVDEAATYEKLDADRGGARPTIYHAKLHVLPPGASLDLQTGEVPIFRLAKPPTP
jgi:cyanophycinase